MSEELPYILPSDVLLHNRPDDLWVSLLGLVYGLTPIAKEYKDRKEITPLLANGGKDISHWFDRKTRDIKYVIHPVTGLRVPYTPQGRFPHVNPQVPTVNWRPIAKPWWKDRKYVVGRLTEKPRPLRFINPLAPPGYNVSVVWVAKEESLEQIAERVHSHNSNTRNYTFKQGDRKINMKKKLDDNEIFDERDKFLELGLPDDDNIPAITLCFNGN